MDARIAVLDNGKVRVDDISLPYRSHGEIDVAISAAAICGSDLHTVLGHRSAPARVALGHEGVGRIVAIDDGMSDLRGAPIARGDRVVFSMLHACGECDRCTQGLTMKCRTLLKYGHESIDTPPHATGTLASHVRLSRGMPVVHIPEHLPDHRVVSAGCALATASAIVRAAGDLGSGRRVAVFGAGAMGVFTIAILTSLGCKVYIGEPSVHRRKRAFALGAKPLDNRAAPFPILVEASGSSSAFMTAIAGADVGGHIIAAGSVSPGNTTATVDPAALVTKRLTVTGVHNYTTADFRWGVEWLLDNTDCLALDTMVSPPRPLVEIGAAFEQMGSGEYLRVLVKPEHTDATV